MLWIFIEVFSGFLGILWIFIGIFSGFLVILWIFIGIFSGFKFFVFSVLCFFFFFFKSFMVVIEFRWGFPFSIGCFVSAFAERLLPWLLLLCSKVPEVFFGIKTTKLAFANFWWFFDFFVWALLKSLLFYF